MSVYIHLFTADEVDQIVSVQIDDEESMIQLIDSPEYDEVSN